MKDHSEAINKLRENKVAWENILSDNKHALKITTDRAKSLRASIALAEKRIIEMDAAIYTLEELA